MIASKGIEGRGRVLLRCVLFWSIISQLVVVDMHALSSSPKLLRQFCGTTNALTPVPCGLVLSHPPQLVAVSVAAPGAESDAGPTIGVPLILNSTSNTQLLFNSLSVCV